jgi:peptidoglycan/LPS O-acetylase OafA/YrhL
VAIAGDFVPYAWAPSMFLTLNFVWLFVLGAEIARHLTAIRTRLERLPPLAAAGLVLLVLIILNLDVTGSAFGIRFGPLVEAASGVLVACAIGIPPLVRFLESPPLHYLGRISYSLYLIHGTVIAVCVALAPATLPKSAVVLVAVVLSIGTAELLYRTVERPGTRVGRVLAARLAARAGYRPNT